MPDKSRRVRFVLSLSVAVALLFSAGAFFAGWRQSVITNQRLAQHVHENCIDDARTAAARHALDVALLASDEAKLRADITAIGLAGTGQSRALLAADIVFLHSAISARRADIAATPVQTVTECHSIPR